MNRFSLILRGITVVGVVAALGALFLASGAQQMENGKPKFMEPRFPSYLTPSKTVAELMPQARALVRNKSALQGLGLGIVNGGQTIVLVYSIESEDIALKAVQQALGERGVKAILLPEYEMAGVTKQDALRTWSRPRATRPPKTAWRRRDG